MSINKDSVAKIKEAFGSLPNGKGVTVRQSSHGTDCIEIELDLTLVSQDEVHFAQLLVVSETFGTRNINVGAYERWGGCSTCGNGETHRVTIYARDCTKGIH